MGVKDDADLCPGSEQIIMHPPFRGRQAPAMRCARVVNKNDILRLQRLVGHAGRRHKKAAGDPVTDIAARVSRQTARHKTPGGGDQFLAQRSRVAGDHRHWPAAIPRFSGKSDSKPSREAGQTPRSVIKPVISRAGVTSKP